ncbi:MAG: glycosyltransferase [Deltaproteobacteria bacterium]|nr:glycosyltransferase [Deltaproteobacteria bacterium]
MVSVIVPTFNRGWCLNEAIDSVFSETYGGYELIVVDDGSTDDTKRRLSRYPDVHVLTQRNRGVSAARNSGVAVARGDFIAFLDSDDLWMPEKLSTQVDFFMRNPEAEICQTQEIWVRDGRRMNPGRRHLKASGMFFERSLELCLVSPSAVMIKKRFLSTVGLFDETLPACEDYDLWLRINATIPIFLIDKALVIKRGGHTDQLSSSAGLDKYRIRSIKKLLESGTLSHGQREAALAVLKNKCDIYAAGCKKRGKLEEMAYYHDLATAAWR